MSLPRVASGTLLVYRLFDVAEDIDLAAADRSLAGAGERLPLSGERPGFLDWPERPVSVALGPREIALEDGSRLTASAFVRLFAHGVASVRYEAPLPAGADAGRLAALVHAVVDSDAIDAAARHESDDLCARLVAALLSPHRSEIHETYAIVSVSRFEGDVAPATVVGIDLARVLLGEPPDTALSAQTVEDVTRHRFSYAEDDLCVLDWDTAFVVEPAADRSVPDVLEVATAQLLEFRYYDDVFERELLRVTERLSPPRVPLAWLFLGRYGGVLRRVQNLVVESAEFVERAENAVRVVGDLYLARVYRAAVDRFRIPAWQAGTQRKAEAAARVASILRDEANAMLGHLLEATIVALIVLEIFLAFGR